MDNVIISEEAKTRIKDIEEFARKQQEKIDNEQREKENHFFTLNKEIASLYQRVFDLISVANTCLKCHIRIENFRRKSVHDEMPVACEIVNKKIMLGIYNGENTRVSMYAGVFGLCNFDGVSISGIKDNVNVIGYIPAMEAFIDNFDSFEESFYKYVDHFIEIKNE